VEQSPRRKVFSSSGQETPDIDITVRKGRKALSCESTKVLCSYHSIVFLPVVFCGIIQMHCGTFLDSHFGADRVPEPVYAG